MRRYLFVLSLCMMWIVSGCASPTPTAQLSTEAPVAAATSTPLPPTAVPPTVAPPTAAPTATTEPTLSSPTPTTAPTATAEPAQTAATDALPTILEHLRYL
ncbi:MAG: hypothetical protein ACK2UQ_06720, partial [Anaerolineae bacterium]